jgi:hypothetical protein
MVRFPLPLAVLLLSSMDLASAASFVAWQPADSKRTLSYGLKVPLQDRPAHFHPLNRRGPEITTRREAILRTRLNSLAHSSLASVKPIATRSNSLSVSTLAFMNSLTSNSLMNPLSILLTGCFFAVAWFALAIYLLNRGYRYETGSVACAVIALLSFGGGCIGSWKRNWVYVLPVSMNSLAILVTGICFAAFWFA